MPQGIDIDVVIGGGGVAGTVTAAALQRLGYDVLVVEPGLNDERRLAGEVFHPPAVAGLTELGLLDALNDALAAPIHGFSLSWAARSDPDLRLPYAAVRTLRTGGLGLEHALIRARLLAAVAALPRVTVAHGRRIVAIDQSNPAHALVHVADGKTITPYRCRLVVAADGAHSRLGRSVGIGFSCRRISTMFAYRLAVEHLPARDYAQVILGAHTPVLVYPISRSEARILFDVPHAAGRLPRLEDCAGALAMLSPNLRREVERAAAAQPRLSIVTQAVTPDRLAQGRVVLVGDAGGSCHPLTASGMTRCVNDALLLGRALADAPAELARALKIYQRRRRWPQATRLALADAARDVLSGATPEGRVMQRGVFAYCGRGAPARAAAMAVLSTADGRPLAVLREVGKVMVHGFLAHLRSPLSPDNKGVASTWRVAIGLTAAALRHVTQIVTSALPMLRWRSSAEPSAAKAAGPARHGAS